MKTPIGIDKTSGEIKLISEVDKGLACNCRCPNDSCRADLVAKTKIGKITPHFAHHNKTGNHQCSEGAVHLLAKHLICEGLKLSLPALQLESSLYQSVLNEALTTKHTYFNSPLQLESATPEVELLNGAIKVDVLCNIQLDKKTFPIGVEIFVTHEVDEDKYQLISDGDLSVLEIDLSDFPAQESLPIDRLSSALYQQPRLSWINISTALMNHLKETVEILASTECDKRNIEIELWSKNIRNYLESTGEITLPHHPLPKGLFLPDRDLLGKDVKLQLPKPPKLSENCKIHSVDPLEDQVFVMKCSYNNRFFELPLGIKTPTAKALDILGTHLALTIEELPSPDSIYKFLQWGHSVAMHEFISTIRKTKEAALSRRNTQVKTELDSAWRWYQSICNRKTMPELIHTDRIEPSYIEAREELIGKGIPLNGLLKDFSDGWIFGCPSKYWQTLLIRMMCLVNNDRVNVKYYAQQLKDYHGLDTVEPVRTLNFNKNGLKLINQQFAYIPNTYKLLWDFFIHLESKHVLHRTGDKEFSKLFPCGHEYRAIKPNSYH